MCGQRKSQNRAIQDTTLLENCKNTQQIYKAQELPLKEGGHSMKLLYGALEGPIRMFFVLFFVLYVLL